MSHSSSSSRGEDASVAAAIQSTLQAGLAALKQREYARAIVQLEAVCQKASHTPTLLKAQMGLVKAYSSTGKIDRAISLCQSLRDNANPQVQAWVTTTLAELERRSAVAAQPSDADTTGFVPLSNHPAARPATVRQRVSLEKSRSDREANRSIEPETESETEREADRSIKLEADREFQEPELTEILPVDADVDWRSVTEIPKPGKRLSKPSAVSKALAPVHAPGVASHLPVQPSSTPLTWRQAGRAQKWTNLGKTNASLLWGLQPLTLLLLGWILCTLIQVGQTLLNGLIFCFSWLPFMGSIWFGGNPIWGVGVGLIGLFAASPWLLHLLLQRIYRLKPLSLSELEQYSPESVRLLKRGSQQHSRAVPRLGILPVPVPVIFSYGYLPHLASIVVSQGLLQRLSDDEIATLYAAELAHVDYWDIGVTSVLVLVAQLPYRVYWSVAAWGNQQADRVLQSVAVLVSFIAYGVYCCCRLAGLWLSRLRLYYSDRSATNLTGNPNGLSRALLKLSIGMAEEIQRQGYTHPLLESFDLLLPVAPQSALTLGSLYLYRPTPALLTWDRLHRFRRWFACQSSHPLLGDRLSVLSSYAQRWRLETELEWGKAEGRGQRAEGRGQGIIQAPSLRQFLLQISPIVGVLVGLAIGLILWLLGWITYRAHSYSFDWLWYGRGAIARGCMLLGFGVGLLIQINPSFPDLPRSNRASQPAPPNSDLLSLLSNPTAMPIDGTPVRLQGKLLGRHRFHNRCYQDLLLQTSIGLIRLHYSSSGGFLGNLLSQSQRPTDLLKSNQTVSVTGWLRRSAVAQVDVETIQTDRGITVRSGRPIWLATVAIVSALWGTYTIFRG